MNKNPTTKLFDEYDIGDFCKVRSVDSSSECIILFTGANTPVGRFNYIKSFANWNINQIFLNCRAEDYYHLGIPGLGNFEETVLKLKSLISDLIGPNGTLYTFGCSMGGYGALVYGVLLKADKIISLAGSTPISSEYLLGQSDKNKHVNKFNELFPLIEKSSSSKVILHGDSQLNDIYSHFTFRHLSNTKAKLYINSSHPIVTLISQRVNLEYFVKSIIKKERLLTSLMFDELEFKDTEFQFLKASLDGYEKDGLIKPELINDIAQVEVNSPAALYTKACLYLKKNETEKAKDILKKSLENYFHYRSLVRLHGLLDESSENKEIENIVSFIQIAISNNQLKNTELSEQKVIYTIYESCINSLKEKMKVSTIDKELAEGYFEGFDGSQLKGWSFPTKCDTEKSAVKVLFNKNFVAEVGSEHYRADLEKHDKKDGYCYFKLGMNIYDMYNNDFNDRSVNYLSIIEKSTNTELINSNYPVKIPFISCYLDVIEDRYIKGWVVDRSYPEATFNLMLCINNAEEVLVPLTIKRKELAEMGFLEKCGFHIDLKNMPNIKWPAVCSLYVENTEILVRDNIILE